MNDKKVNIEFTEEDVVTSSHEVPTIMSKDQYDGIVEMNKKSIDRQVKRKKAEDDMEDIRKELKELKEIMYLQMQVDKQRKQLEPPAKNLDEDGFVDLTNSPKKHTSLGSPTGVVRGDVKFPVSAPVVIKEQQSSPTEILKKENKVKGALFAVSKLIGIGLLAIILLIGITLLFRYVIGMNWFLSGIASFTINTIILTTWYLLTRNPAKNRLRVKNLTEFQDLEFSEIRTCPKCDSKLHKSKVINNGTEIFQYFKCKNVECDFQKKVQFPNQSVGY